jgi:hypothetical protein
VILKLMRKDLLLSWSLLIAIFGSTAANVLIWAIEGGRAGFVLAFGSTIAGFLPIMISGRDDRYRTNAFACALPVSRRQIVLARYLLCPVLFPVWTLCLILMLWAFSGFRLPAELLRPDAYITALAVQALAVAVFAPLMLRFGYKGFVYGLIGLQVLGLLVLVVGSRVGLAGGILAFEGAIGRIGPGVRDLHARMGDAAFFPAAVAAVAATLGLSYFVSCVLYQRRDL